MNAYMSPWQFHKSLLAYMLEPREMHKSEKHKTYGKVSFISKEPEIRQLEQFLIDSGRQAPFWITWPHFSEDLNFSDDTTEDLVYIESDHIVIYLPLVCMPAMPVLTGIYCKIHFFNQFFIVFNFINS